MATVVTKTINAGGGGDYTTLQAALDALKQDLIASDTALRLEVVGNVGPGVFNVGWSADATRSVTIYRKERHSGAFAFADVNIEYITANTSISTISAEGVVVDGCIINHYTNQGVTDATNSGSGGRFVTKNCIIYTNSSSSTPIARAFKAINNIIIGTFAQAITFRSNAAGEALCNTIVGTTGKGIVGNITSHVSTNNVVQGCTDGFSGTFASGSDYNISDIAGDAPGTHSKTGVVAFRDAAAKDYHLSPADTVARGAGINLTASGITTDIDGDARPATGAWDIGADQVVESPTPTPGGGRKPWGRDPWGRPAWGRAAWGRAG